MKTLEDVRADLERTWPEDRPIDHRGWRFTAPFHCFRCGVQIPAYQFAFARACGGCDVGGYDSPARFHLGDRRAFAGPHEQIGNPGDPMFISPEWIDPANRDQYPRAIQYLRRPRLPRVPKKTVPPR